jgi:hypothetical protein
MGIKREARGARWDAPVFVRNARKTAWVQQVSQNTSGVKLLLA